MRAHPKDDGSVAFALAAEAFRIAHQNPSALFSALYELSKEGNSLLVGISRLMEFFEAKGIHVRAITLTAEDFERFRFQAMAYMPLREQRADGFFFAGIEIRREDSP
ncbi:MAG TPA: hypothetical protein PKA27_07015 [Fimbriimonadaceae bacterium]|nr:hypothetical protein [Fimbriimonadaceae bacterium]